MIENFRKVLIIAYYFPPMGLSGVQRTVKFAKYLPQFGWKPTVLTVNPTGYYAMDESLLKEVEEAGVEIVRTNSLDANRLFAKKRVVRMPSERTRKILQFLGDTFFIPDTKIGWKSKALKKAKELLNEQHFDAVLATAPPQTDFLIGAAIKRATEIPLIVDYRDSWLKYPYKYFPTPLHYYLHYRLEKKVLKAADRVLVTHRRVKENLIKRHRSLQYHDVTILSQGYDPSDFDVKPPERLQLPLRLRITHTGTFYGGRNPSTILRALKNILDKHTQMRGRIELNFVGNARKEDKHLVKQLGLQNEVVFRGYLEHQESVNQILSSDVLWFILDNDFQTPGKLYEYFGARKPILASVADGYTKQLILESECAVCVPIHDLSAHEQALVNYFDQFERKSLKRIPELFASRFDRLALTGELAKQLESLMNYDGHAFIKIGTIKS
jgi:glycosyltransferase involved in cell wall biosynthesis